MLPLARPSFEVCLPSALILSSILRRHGLLPFPQSIVSAALKNSDQHAIMTAAATDIPPWVIGVAGSTGATLANAVIYPLDVVKTRLQTQLKTSNGDCENAKHRYYRGIWHGILSILRDEGYPGLYRGLPTSSIGTASTNYAYFYWYTILRTVYITKLQLPNAISADLGVGSAAGALAQLCTAPIGVIATRQQTRPDGKKESMLECARNIVDGPDGYSGLWKGMKASLLLSVNPAITYGAYQRLREALVPNCRAPNPHEAFCESSIIDFRL